MTIIRWMEDNKMELNVNKCGVMRYPTSNVECGAIIYGEEIIPMCKEY